MKQIALPPSDASPAYDHVLRLSIYLSVPKGAGSNPLTGLDWHILGFDTADRGENCGSPAGPGRDTDALVHELLTAPHVHAPVRKKQQAPTPADTLLDFRTLASTLVVIRLFGDALWAFNSRGITTKDVQTAPGYQGLVGYRLVDGAVTQTDDPDGCPAVAFEVHPKMPPSKLGINFHVDFKEAGLQRMLPVIIDPDGSNGGARPPGSGPG